MDYQGFIDDHFRQVDHFYVCVEVKILACYIFNFVTTMPRSLDLGHSLSPKRRTHSLTSKV
jgi:hypothetical protein